MVALALLASCGSSLDSIGCDERTPTPDGGAGLDGGAPLAPLLGPVSYPNAFKELLGKSDSEIADKISAAFDQLFHGDPSSEAIYFTTGTNQAYIRDIYHNDIRTEGIGLGMMITVELGKRDEFDRLWRFAKSIQTAGGASQGYFPSFCNTDMNSRPCSDPFGQQQITTAMLLARGRWQNAPGNIDYQQEARDLLDVLRYKEAYNCGIVDDVTGIFDPKSKLAYDTPTTASANISRPSIAMPAYYELWQQATHDAFWSQTAVAARNYWQASAHKTTGLVPQRATFDGTPVTGSDTFKPESYRMFVNMALDRIWFGGQPWVVDESDRLLRFFYGEGIDTYGASYTLDGSSELDSSHQGSHIAANGALASIASIDQRTEFIAAVWNQPLSTGAPRYYSGIMNMMALLLLGGQMRVY